MQWDYYDDGKWVRDRSRSVYVPLLSLQQFIEEGLTEASTSEQKVTLHWKYVLPVPEPMSCWQAVKPKELDRHAV